MIRLIHRSGRTMGRVRCGTDLGSRDFGRSRLICLKGIFELKSKLRTPELLSVRRSNRSIHSELFGIEDSTTKPRADSLLRHVPSKGLFLAGQWL